MICNLRGYVFYYISVLTFVIRLSDMMSWLAGQGMLVISVASMFIVLLGMLVLVILLFNILNYLEKDAKGSYKYSSGYSLFNSRSNNSSDGESRK
jgi:hypothetical protein